MICNRAELRGEEIRMRMGARNQLKGTIVEMVKGGRGAGAARLGTALALAIGLTSPSFAAEPSGCDGFKWPIARELAVLKGPASELKSGAAIEISGKAIRLALGPQADAKLPSPPERLPKEPETIASRFAGYVRIDKVPAAGTYTVALSAAAWLDAIQDGKALKPAAFSGATDCEGIRKVVKFELAGSPLVLQVSSVAANEIVLTVLRAE